MAVTKYFINPFATAGDRTDIPDNAQPSGSVSYADGFTSDYELVQTDPSSKDIPRQETNELFFDITNNIQQYQQSGIPNFITTTDNEGTPYSYSIGAKVLYDDGVNGIRAFESLINLNTALPSDTTMWRWVNNTAGAIVLDGFNASIFDSPVVNGDVVYWNESISKYSQALANGAIQQNAVGIADTDFNRIYSVGDVNFLTGLTAGEVYYLSETLPGKITNISPTNNVIQVGFSKSTTELFLNIQSAISTEIIYNGSGNYAADTGTANVYTANLNPAITSYFIGMPVRIKILNMNTAASTLSLNSLSPVNILSNSHESLNPADLMPEMIAEFIYDGTNFVLMNPAKNVVSLRAALTTPYNLPAGSYIPVIFQTEELNINANYNTTTGLFTCEIPGIYRIISQVNCILSLVGVPDDGLDIYIYLNGTSISSGTVNSAAPSDCSAIVTSLVSLSVGDTIQIHGGTDVLTSTLSDQDYTYLEINRVY